MFVNVVTFGKYKRERRNISTRCVQHNVLPPVLHPVAMVHRNRLDHDESTWVAVLAHFWQLTAEKRRTVARCDALRSQQSRRLSCRSVLLLPPGPSFHIICVKISVYNIQFTTLYEVCETNAGRSLSCGEIEDEASPIPMSAAILV